MVYMKVSQQVRAVQLRGVCPSHGWNGDPPKDMSKFRTPEPATVTLLVKGPLQMQLR